MEHLASVSRCAGRDMIELRYNTVAGLSSKEYLKKGVIISQDTLFIYITKGSLLMVFRN
jgi:hypothetical protein